MTKYRIKIKLRNNNNVINNCYPCTLGNVKETTLVTHLSFSKALSSKKMQEFKSTILYMQHDYENISMKKIK